MQIDILPYVFNIYYNNMDATDAILYLFSFRAFDARRILFSAFIGCRRWSYDPRGGNIERVFVLAEAVLILRSSLVSIFLLDLLKLSSGGMFVFIHQYFASSHLYI